MTEQELDITSRNLAKAIRQKESGGDYNAVGDNGTSRGAWQWQAATWKGHAQEILGDANAEMTPEHQNVVAKGMMRKYIQQGKDAAQIAAIWNSGSDKGWENKVGTNVINGKPIQYNVPQYVKSVTENYQKFKSESQLQQQEVQQPEAPQVDKPGLLASIGNAITDPFVALGGGVANIIRPMIGQEVNREKIPSIFGGEGVNPVGSRDGQELGAVDTAQQLAGNVAMAGSNFVGGGIAKSVGGGILAKTLPVATQLAKEGAIAGGAQLGGQAMSEGKSAGDVALETVKGVGIGAIATPLIGVPLGLLPLATSAGRGAVTKELESKYITQNTDDWARVGSDYVRSGGVLAKEGKFGKDSPKFLGELGISPNRLIENGKFQTEDIAKELSTTAVKDFDNTLTDMLKAAQFSNKKPDLTRMEINAISKIKDIKNITEAQRLQIAKNIKQEFSALKGKYGDSITLPSLNEQKGNYWANTKFDATKPFQSDVNYIIGSTMRQTIEDSVQDAPVRELNQLLGNYYSAAKFLRSINKREPKQTAIQKVGGTLSRAAGTLVGSAMGGTGGAVSGYLFGKTLADVLNKASNPVKTAVLNNLEKTNPQAFDEALKYLGHQQLNILKNVSVKQTTSSQVKGASEIQNAVKSVVK